MKFLKVFCLPVLMFLFFPSCVNDKGEIYSDIYAIQRRNMVRWQLLNRGIKSKSVLQAMNTVPRHIFLPPKSRRRAYADEDIPIGRSIGQFVTTPRPFVVAKTIELLDLKGKERVLEVGTGRGYQSALLAELAKEVYTIEIVPEIAEQAKNILTMLQYGNVYTKIGDGYKGWAEEAPFDAILVMASAQKVPDPLFDQLAQGGRLVMPIGEPENQSLLLYRKVDGEIRQETVMPIRLKPLEGQAARQMR